MSHPNLTIRVACLVLDNPPPGSPEDLAYGPFHFGMASKVQFSVLSRFVSLILTLSRYSLPFYPCNPRSRVQEMAFCMYSR